MGSKREIKSLKDKARQVYRAHSFEGKVQAACFGLLFGGLTGAGILLAGTIYGAYVTYDDPPPCVESSVLLSGENAKLTCGHPNRSGGVTPTGSKLVTEMLPDGKTVLAKCVCGN